MDVASNGRHRCMLAYAAAPACLPCDAGSKLPFGRGRGYGTRTCLTKFMLNMDERQLAEQFVILVKPLAARCDQVLALDTASAFSGPHVPVRSTIKGHASARAHLFPHGSVAAAGSGPGGRAVL